MCLCFIFQLPLVLCIRSCGAPLLLLVHGSFHGLSLQLLDHHISFLICRIINRLDPHLVQSGLPHGPDIFFGYSLPLQNRISRGTLTTLKNLILWFFAFCRPLELFAAWNEQPIFDFPQQIIKIVLFRTGSCKLTHSS